MIRAAIVGLGRWGRALVNAVTGPAETARPSGLHFALAVTRTRASAEAFCREKNIALADSYDDILRDPDVDAVVLATPHSQHQAQALAAIAARKHVFVEKPLTLDLPSARAVADAAHRAGLILAVGFTRRFHPSIGELRVRLAGGRLGDVVSLVAPHKIGRAHVLTPVTM
jgi:predicted dehydrogenase